MPGSDDPHELGELSYLLDDAPAASEADGLDRIVGRARSRRVRSRALAAVAVLAIGAGVGYGVSQTGGGTHLNSGPEGQHSKLVSPTVGPYVAGPAVLGPAEPASVCINGGRYSPFIHRVTTQGISVEAAKSTSGVVVALAGVPSAPGTLRGMSALPTVAGSQPVAISSSSGTVQALAVVAVQTGPGVTAVSWNAGGGDHMAPVDGYAVLAVLLPEAAPLGSLTYHYAARPDVTVAVMSAGRPEPEQDLAGLCTSV